MSPIYPQMPETAAVYTFIGPDGTRAVLNNTADPDYVGTFGDDGITGLDDPEVRENAWDLVEADGGVHGNFWYGRRPITASIDLISPVSAADRLTKYQKLKRATRAMRADGTLQWTTPNSIGGNQQVTFRKQQPTRVTGAWLKTVNLALVCADPRIYGTTLNSQTIAQNGSGTINNNGDFNSPPSLRLNGPGTGPTITMNGFPLKFPGLVLSAGQNIVIDLLQRTITKSDGTNQYGTLDFTNSVWSLLAPGANSVSESWTSGSTAASTLVVSWRDAWI